MQWLIDIIKDWVIAQAYATEAWVEAKFYATVAQVLTIVSAAKTWMLAQLCTSTARVYLTANQSIPTSTYTRINFDAESWDVGSEFANYVFTAKEAGYFQVNLQAMGVSIPTDKRFQVAIYKNGVISRQSIYRICLLGYAGSLIGEIVHLNGTTDYIEGRVYHDSGVAKEVYGHPRYTFMSIHQLSKDA